MSPTDRAALERAIAACRARDRASANQIDSMLVSEPWADVATFAAFSAQMDSLDLLPWLQPPCWSSLSDLSKPFDDLHGEREAAELLKRLLAAGLSRYEPDPLGALERAEAERAKIAK